MDIHLFHKVIIIGFCCLTIYTRMNDYESLTITNTVYNVKIIIRIYVMRALLYWHTVILAAIDPLMLPIVHPLISERVQPAISVCSYASSTSPNILRPRDGWMRWCDWISILNVERNFNADVFESRPSYNISTSIKMTKACMSKLMLGIA